MKKRHSGGLRQSAVCAGLVLLCAALISLTACDEDSDDSPGELGRIISFSVGSSIGDIDQETGIINVVVPADTMVNALTPDILLSDGATIVEPVAAMQNFTKPIKYKVTTNGRIHEYAVYVIKERNDRNEIISFAFGDIYGEIDPASSKIKVTVPEGTDVSTPVITVPPGTTVDLDADEDTLPDFKKPVRYVVTADNGAKRIYAVEVTWEWEEEVTLLEITVEALKKEFTEADKENLQDFLVVTGKYSDGSYKQETEYEISGLSFQEKQNIVVTKGNKTAVVEDITIANTPLAVSIGFLNDTPVIYGVTYTAGKIDPIVISRSGTGRPKSVVISAGAGVADLTETYANPTGVYDTVQWLYNGSNIDTSGTPTAKDNILTIYAAPLVVGEQDGTHGGFYIANNDYNYSNNAFAIDKTYYVTFVGTKNSDTDLSHGNEFTVNIPFTVVR